MAISRASSMDLEGESRPGDHIGNDLRITGGVEDGTGHLQLFLELMTIECSAPL